MKFGIKGVRATVAVAIVLAAVICAAAQQGRDDKYKQRALAQVVELNRDGADQVFKKAKLDERQAYIPVDPFYSRAALVYVGQSRPIAAERRGLIEPWRKLQRAEKKFVELYEAEYLIKEGDAEHWIPLQRSTARDLAANAKAGDAIELYVFCVGAQKEKGASVPETIFIATGFRK